MILLSRFVIGEMYYNSLYLPVYLLAVTFPRLEGVAQQILRRYTNAGPAIDCLGDAAVSIIKARQQEGSDITVRPS